MDAAPIRDYLNASTGSQHLHVSIGADMTWDLEMEAHDIRSPLYSERVLTDGREMQLAKRENITFRGREVSGGGRAALTIDDDFLYGFIRKGDIEFFIEPLTYVLKDAPTDLFILYEASDAIQNEVFTCGVEETQQKTEEIKHDLEEQNRVLDNCYVLQLAIASDYLMYQGYMNSTTNVGNHNIAVMNNVQTNYTDDFADDIEFQIVTQYYSTTSNEPWPNSTDIEVILYDFADWAQGGGFGTTHDLGQFWSRRDYNGASVGLAFVGVVCTSGFKYHVLQDFTTNASQLRCMTSHEIGHNFNASHDADNSTHIMAPFVSSSNTWSTASQNSINAHIANRASWGSCFTFCSTPPTGASPTAQFVGSPVSGCAPLSVQFTDQSAGSPTSWSWSFPGGTPSTSTAQNPTVFYSSGGTYSVTLTATNAMGSDQEVKSNYISVTGMPVANFTTFTAGSNAVFTNTSTNATSYFWEFGDGATSTQTNPTHFYAASGTYSVTLTASNNCGSDMEIKNVIIVLPPIADFFANVTQGCAPLMVQFTDQSSNNPTSWSWTLPGGAPTSSTQQNPTVVYNFPGTFTVTLTVMNSAGQDIMTITGYITVQAPPNAGFNSNSSGLTANFTNTSTNATSYLWNFGDGFTSSAVNPAHTYATGGTYAVTLTATGPCGSDIQVNNVVIQGPPDPAFSANVTNGCAPLIVQFTDISTGNPTSWEWLFPGGNPASSILQNPVVTYNAPGSYSVTMTATNASGDSTAIASNFITVSNITANTGADQSICTGQTATLTASGGGTYLWSNNLGSNATVTTPALSQATTYTVTVTNGNCTATDQVTITLLPLPAAAFTSNISGAQVSFTNTSSNADSYDWDFGDGNFSIETSPEHTFENNDVYTVSLIANNECGADTAYETVEIIIINTNDLSGQIIFGLYPNPNYGQFTMVLSGNSAQVVSYKMTNVLGQVLDEQFLSLNGGNLTKDFDYPNIVAGSYFITLSSGGKSVFKKIIVY